MQVLAGNDLPRLIGCEDSPPIAVSFTSQSPQVEVQGPSGRGTTSATVYLTNYTRVNLSLQGTVTIPLANGVSATGVQVSTGVAVIQGNQIVWNGFNVDSNSQASATISLTSTATAAGGGSSASFQSVNIDAVTIGTGERVVEQTGATGPALAALAAVSAAPAAPVAPVSAGAAAAALAAAPAQVAVSGRATAPGQTAAATTAYGQGGAGPVAATPPSALPRTGVAPPDQAPLGPAAALPALLGGLALLGAGFWLLQRRRATLR